MTDKQMAEKRKEFFYKFIVTMGDGTVRFRDVYFPENVWDFIEKLVEEAEREAYERGYIDGENRKKITDRLRELL